LFSKSVFETKRKENPRMRRGRELLAVKGLSAVLNDLVIVLVMVPEVGAAVFPETVSDPFDPDKFAELEPQFAVSHHVSFFFWALSKDSISFWASSSE
jgi:predicted cobalt transporter CbtA